jgi:hypothetical protein
VPPRRHDPELPHDLGPQRFPLLTRRVGSGGAGVVVCAAPGKAPAMVAAPRPAPRW